MNYFICVFIISASMGFSQALTRKALSKDALKVSSFYFFQKDYPKANHFLNFAIALDSMNKEALLVQAMDP